MKSGIIFCFAGPSGSGKTTLADIFRKNSGGSVSRITTVTTRPPRNGEIDGVDYHFWGTGEFLHGVNSNLFFEHELVHGNMYGTLRSSLEEVIERKDTAAIILDVNGAIKLKETFPSDVVNVFMTCTNKEELRRRIEKRNTSTEDVNRRLSAASSELATYSENTDKFNYLIINDDIEASWTVLVNIMIHEKARRGKPLLFQGE